MKHLFLAAALVFAACSPAGGTDGSTTAKAPEAAVPVYGYQVVASYPHDTGAFTEGLFYLDGVLYESTGLEGASSIRKVDLATGKVLQQRDTPEAYFGEGIVNWKDRLISLTWKNNKGFVHDLATFEPKSEWTYPGEGWALTQDGARIIMSDGTTQLRFLDPETLRETGRVRVTLRGEGLANLNELEWIKGEVWANIWMTDWIVRIDPESGKVVGRIDLAGLLKGEDVHAGNPDQPPDVLNGIAYDAAGDRIFVTGKWWPKIYEIKLTQGA
jgi:glutaminyl-peptide cyclotransferase